MLLIAIYLVINEGVDHDLYVLQQRIGQWSRQNIEVAIGNLSFIQIDRIDFNLQGSLYGVYFYDLRLSA